MSIQFAILVTVLGLALGQQQGGRRRATPAPVPPVPDISLRCLDCICEASSGCDKTLRCHNAGQGQYFCGPYVISWAYWHDGGRPGDHGRASDFETCLNNKTCAEQAVRGYMNKHGKDCNGDDAVTCHDFSRIHKMGPGACSSDSIDNTDYWQSFLECCRSDPGSSDYYGFYDGAAGNC